MSRVSFFRAGLPALAAALALAACEDGPTSPAGRDPADLAASVVQGDAQAGTVGRALADSVVLRVTDRGGSPVRGLELEWRVLSEGGEVLRGTTTTDRDGRSANGWVLGTRAGEQQVEVRALLRDGPAALDTVRASAAADVPAELRLVGDSVRALGVGDTVRLAVQGTDRFGNPVPAAALRPRWSSLQPAVAVSDSAGLVRVVGAGEATVEAAVGTARARAYLRSQEGVEELPVGWSGHYPWVRRFYQGGGRLLAVGAEAYHASIYNLTFGFGGTAWSSVGGTGAAYGGYTSDLYVAPDGTAYATGSVHTQVSAPGGPWRPDSALTGWERVTGAGSTVFGYRQTGYPVRYGVERLSGGRLTDLGLPAQYAGRTVYSLAAAGESELYLAADGETLHWNGAGWTPVGLSLGRLAAPSGGGVVHGVLGRSALYVLRQGRAERIANPLEDRGETIQSLAVDRDGNPYLLYRAGVVYRTAAGWREHRFTREWTSVSAVWAADDGSVWVSAYRATEERTYYGIRHELVMLRIRARAQ
ncbi:MAG TPA: hypothetical protein VFQ76_16845 [Longimicrobiaceae bacterium]|nr:hypothetical protein [Longimicrobiaceae bacterium]